MGSRRVRRLTQAPPAAAAHDSGWRPAAALAFGLALLTLVTFLPVRHFSFVNYDDVQFLVDNPHIATGFSVANVRWAFSHPYEFTGGPITWLSHMADFQMFGLDAGGHHLDSLALHVLNTILLFVVLVSLTGARGRGAFVAALFAVHPLHVESVAWISERKDVLSTTFWFLSIGAYVWYARRPSAARYAAMTALFVCGLLAKPMVATLPATLLLLDVWPLGRLSRASVVEKLPLAVPGVAAIYLTWLSQRALGAVTSAEVVPFGLRWLNAPVSCVAYLEKMVWPARLIPFYPYRFDLSIALGLVCAIALAVATWLAIRARAAAPYVTVGWLWYLVTLVPVLGIVQVGGHAMADRFTYVPLIGIFIIVAWAGEALLSRLAVGLRASAATALAILLVLACVARVQAQHWESGIALWTHAVAVSPENARAEANLGTALATAGDPAAAVDPDLAAVRLQPGDPRLEHNLGLALSGAGRGAEAIPHYREAVRLNPGFAAAHIDLATELGRQGDAAAASAEYDAALRLDPGNVLARANRAIALARQGREAEAIPEMRDVMRRAPTDPRWPYMTALMCIRLERFPEATALLNTTLQLDPSNRDAREALASLAR